MANQLIVALEITLVGMGLIFGAIILLWLGMSLLVRVTADRNLTQHGLTEGTSLETASDARRRQAAAAAVVIALQADKGVRRQPVLPPTATISPWQSVMRGRQLKQKGPVR